METKELKENVDILAKGAIQHLKSNGSHPLTFTIVTIRNDGTKGMLPFSITESFLIEKRQSLVRASGSACREMIKNNIIQKVDGIFLISEAWMSKVKTKKDQKIDDTKFVMPSQDPNKTEGLIVIGMSDSYECYSSMNEITRNSNNEIKSIKKLLKNQKPTQLKNPLLDEFWKGFGTLIN